jgi:PAS domain S-box-containing protein
MSSDGLTQRRLNIVLVEDNDDDAALLERHLRRSGMLFHVQRVQTAAEMQAALRNPEPPDVVLADYNLPLFSGPEALQALKAAGLDVPFIMMSGAVSEETAVAAMRAGAHDYVSKGNLTRLIPAIDRELKEAGIRRNRLAAERALQASEERFHALVEAMPLGLILSDSDGRITYANRAAERLLHYPEDTLLPDSTNIAAICPAFSDAHSALAANTLSTEPFEATCTTRDGHPVEVLVGVAFLNPEASAKDRQLAAFLADLTIQKRSEELLVATSDISSSAREYLELAQRELDRVSQITIQTLRFHRASTKSRLVNVEDLIETVLTLLDSRMRDQKIELVRDFHAHPQIHAHDGEIRQVVANLIGNAIDALPEGGRILVRAAYSRDWRSGSPGVVVTVADTGIGMDAETSRRIFEPFFSTKGMTGTGLGLWVSSEIAEKHQGSLRVRSRRHAAAMEPGGTVFRFFFRPQDEPGSAA